MKLQFGEGKLILSGGHSPESPYILKIFENKTPAGSTELVPGDLLVEMHFKGEKDIAQIGDAFQAMLDHLKASNTWHVVRLDIKEEPE